MIRQNYNTLYFSDLINYTNYLIILKPKKYIPPLMIVNKIPQNIKHGIQRNF